MINKFCLYLFFFACLFYSAQSFPDVLGINEVSLSELVSSNDISSKTNAVSKTNETLEPVDEIKEKTTNVSEKSEEPIKQSEDSEEREQSEDSEKKPTKKNKEDPLYGEADIILREIRSIAELYSRLPKNKNSRITLLRALLKRLNNIEPRTEFLRHQKRIMEAGILFRLNDPRNAEKRIYEVVQQSEWPEVREKAAGIFLSHAVVQGNNAKIKEFCQKMAPRLSNQFKELIGILMNADEITEANIDFVIQNIISAPLGSNHPPETAMRFLSRIRHKVTADDMDSLINTFIYENNLKEVVGSIKVRLEIAPVEFEMLNHWAESLGSMEGELVKLLRAFPENSVYKEFIAFYYRRANAVKRGRIYNVQLYRHRGETRSPYHLQKAEDAFTQYLEGNVEERYIKINTEYVFRNFLAFKRYDKIVEYGAKIKEKMWDGFTLPYMNFWYAYALLEEGQTNDTVLNLLGDVIVADPESYYGMLSQSLLETLFDQRAYSRYAYLNARKKATDTTIGKIKYAYSLYYLGSYFEKLQSEKMFADLGIIRPQGRSQLSGDTQSLLFTYLSLGLMEAARMLAYKDGVTNPYIQDKFFGEYLLSQNKANEYQKLVSYKSVAVQNSLSFVIGKRSMAVYYPMPYHQDLKQAIASIGKEIDPYLVYSVMRAESFYKPRARSHAGARGLMQIMPATGTWLASRMKIKDFKINSLYDPTLNIYLGVSYLYENIDRMGLVPALAAYNSGPTYVNKLIRKYTPNSDIELVEIHPKRETRDYVRKIMEFYYRYKIVYDGQSIDLFKVMSL